MANTGLEELLLWLLGIIVLAMYSYRRLSGEFNSYRLCQFCMITKSQLHSNPMTLACSRTKTGHNEEVNIVLQNKSLATAYGVTSYSVLKPFKLLPCCVGFAFWYITLYVWGSILWCSALCDNKLLHCKFLPHCWISEQKDCPLPIPGLW